MKRSIVLPILLALVAGISSSSLAYETSEVLHYQGVLRDAAGNPLNGDFEMVFRYWSERTGGNEIMVELRNELDSADVTVTNGLFSVELGAGFTTDGSGPGSFDLLPKVFHSHLSVFLEIQVGTEVLSPRLPIRAAPWAINTLHLGGMYFEDFVTRTESPQTKSGPFTVDTSALPGSFALTGRGPGAGGYFLDSDSGAEALVGSGGYGPQGYGDTGGAYLEDTNGSGYAIVGTGDQGIRGFGSFAGGYFKDSDDSGYSYAGYSDWGTIAYGNAAGGYFQDLDSSAIASVAAGDHGIHARGSYQGVNVGGGGKFEDSSYSGMMIAAHGDRGIYAEGSWMGGDFRDTNSSSFGWVGYNTYKIYGTGTVSFVQNHPEESDKVVVYHAPEASEVGVYTRGIGRLRDGSARIELDETFRWVANPDLGLTAHLTPRGIGCALFSKDVGTSTLTVAADEPQCSDVEFDYMVQGLRIGFEELAPVQKKQRESKIPSMASHRALYAADESLKKYSALDRFLEMDSRLRGSERSSIDLSRSAELVSRIGEHVAGAALPAGRVEATVPEPPHDTAPSKRHRAVRSNGEIAVERVPETAAAADRIGGLGIRAEFAETRIEVLEPVEAGELLVHDPLRPGLFRRAAKIADPNIVGVAGAASEADEDGAQTVTLADGRYVDVRVDASHGEVRPGDLLISSPTPGTAMATYDTANEGVFARALHGLANGVGTVRVQMISR